MSPRREALLAGLVVFAVVFTVGNLLLPLLGTWRAGIVGLLASVLAMHYVDHRRDAEDKR